jgi:hypothetical protein
MNESFLAIFRIGEYQYDHVMDKDTDTVHVRQLPRLHLGERESTLLMTIDYYGVVRLHDSTKVFENVFARWSIKHDQTWNITIEETKEKFNFGRKDLIWSEVMFSHQYVRKIYNINENPLSNN